MPPKQSKKKIVVLSDSESSEDIKNKSDSDTESDESVESSESDTNNESSESDNKKSKLKKSKMQESQSSQKRRGRPRKNITVQKSALVHKPKKTSDGDEDDELILHIPIYDEGDDGDNSSSEKNMFTMKSDDEDEKPSKPFKSLSHSDDDVDVKKLLIELKKKDAIIKRLKATAGESKGIAFHDNTPSFTRETKTKMINLNLIDINKSNKLVVVDKTDIACWYCSYNFNTIPCFLPDRYYESTFYVFGCFCTYSCVMAYNLAMNDSRSSSRISLIKLLYSKIFSTSADAIPKAPERELLQKFGGPLSIEEFRNSALLCKKEFKLALPPMIPLIPVMHEIPKDQTSNYLGHKQPAKKK
jgi:hypothetical protein